METPRCQPHLFVLNPQKVMVMNVGTARNTPQQGDLLSSWLMTLHYLMEKKMDKIQKLNNKKIKLKKLPVLTT